MTEIETFKYKKSQRVKNWYIDLKNKYGLTTKYNEILARTVDILVTGTFIWYIVTFNNFISYGLTAWLAQHYVGWVIDKIKERN